MVNRDSRKTRLSFCTASAAAGAACSLLFCSAAAVSAPTVTQVSGEAATNSVITINGNGFGAGPNLILYDDFESGGLIGSLINLAAARIGDWTDSVGVAPEYDNLSHSGGKSMRVYREGRTAILKKDFPAPTTEVFFSFWVRVPEGTPFPGDSGGVKEFSRDSSWKMAWLIDSSYDGSTSDLSLPTHVGNGNFYLAGNDYSLVQLPSGSTWWSWSSWMRMTVWLRADQSQPTSSGQYLWHVTSSEKGQFKVAGSEPVFDSDGPSQKVYRYINLPGWIRSDGDSRPVYDDIYIASGANAQARVEIGDAPTYAGSRHLALLIPKSWSNGSISAEVPAGAVSTSGGAYLYVTDKDGVVNSEGYVLRKGVSPNPPTGMQVR